MKGCSEALSLILPFLPSRFRSDLRGAAGGRAPPPPAQTVPVGPVRTIPGVSLRAQSPSSHGRERPGRLFTEAHVGPFRDDAASKGQVAIFVASRLRTFTSVNARLTCKHWVSDHGFPSDGRPGAGLAERRRSA